MGDKADAAIHDFLKDPKAFLTPTPNMATAISAVDIWYGGRVIPWGSLFPDKGYFKLVRSYETKTDRTFDIKYHGDKAGDPNTVFAYHLGFNGVGARRVPAYIDIPKKMSEGSPSLLFTGMVTGCSVIVTDLAPNSDNYRVFHDVRTYGSIIYDNVVMAVDYNDYGKFGGPAGCVFMQYRDDEWNLFHQVQDYQPPGGIRPRHQEMFMDPTTEDVTIRVFKPSTYQAAATLENFNYTRDKNRKLLEHFAKMIVPGGVPNEDDGQFKLFEGNAPDLGNDAILGNDGVRHSQKIREEIAKHQKQAQGVELGLMEATINESKSLDSAWLWMKEKETNTKGLAAVLITDQQKKARVGSTAGERFTDQQLYSLLTRDKDFETGYNGFDNVQIPGWASDMTTLEMTTLFDKSPNLTQPQMGALVRRIRDARLKEYSEKVWNQTNGVIEMFQKAGGSTKPMPQDLLLNAVPDELGGRCYPLVRAMSVALAQSEFAVDQLNIKLVSLSSKTDLKNAELFRRCLTDLHSSYPAAGASTIIGLTNIQDAVNKLSPEEGKNTIFALNTDTHAMLIGATKKNGTTSYHFYDPNFAVASFTSKQGLVDATKKFFTEFKFADIYGAGGTTSDPVFTLVKLDTDKMARIDFEYNLTVADFIGPETLMETISIKEVNELQVPDPIHFTENRVMRAGVGLVEASGLAEIWRNATEKLEKSSGLGEHWMPILDTLENVNGGGYRIQFINLENLGETHWISTQDPEIKEFKASLDEHLKAIKKAYKFESGTFVGEEGITSAEGIDGLNAMFVLRTLIDYFSSDKKEGNSPGNLGIALRVHSYLNLTQLGKQTLGDVAKIVNLTKSVIASERAAQSSLSSITRAFSHISEGADILLGGANVFLDAYELGNAQDEMQKAVYGTQLAFDSASFLATVGGVGAGILGASTTAAVLGGAGVILAGLGIGAGALAIAFGQVAQDAKTVGKYFGDTEAAYKAGGYKYDEENKALVPLLGAVISELDLTGNVKFGSQYIYRTHHGKTGSGKINYFFWVGDFPQVVRDKSQAINIREGIGAPASGKLANTTDYAILVLPATPKSYINYNYMNLPFATARKDYGFDVIRRLENDERFDYDFYIFPSEYIIRSISFEYVKTPVTVKLGDRPLRVQVPGPIPNNMSNLLEYTLHGANAQYTIGLMAGVGITLNSATNTRWILDCRDLTNNTVTVKDGSVSVGGVQVTISDRNFSSMIVINKQEEVLQVDFDNHKMFPVQEDASKFPGGSTKMLAYLNDLNDKQLLHGMFIIVENYTTPSGKAVGRAFYDITSKRMLYTVDAPPELTKDMEFGTETSDGVYFYNRESSDIWRVDPKTGTCLAKYLSSSSVSKLNHVCQVDNRVHAVFVHQVTNEDRFGDLSYILEADSMKLVSMVGDPDWLHVLSKLDHLEKPQIGEVQSNSIGFNSTLSSFFENSLSMPGKDIKPVLDPDMLFVYGEDSNKVSYRFWLRASDGAVIKPYFSFPADIVFAGSTTPPGGNVEEFWFYSIEKQQIVIQKGLKQQSNQDVFVTVPAVFGKLSSVFCLQNVMFAVTSAGYVLRITSQGETGMVFLEAVDRRWFTQFESGEKTGPWWTVLKDFAESQGATRVTILGLHDADHAIIPAWLYNGKIIISSSLLSKQQLQLMGLAKGGEEAWLCHWKSDATSQISGELYNQPLVLDNQISTILSPTQSLVISESKVPAGKRVLEQYPCKTVVMNENGLQYTTLDGVILTIANRDSITVSAVDKDWQKKHLQNLEADLGALAKKWNQNEVISLLGEPTSVPAWYLVRAGKKVVATNAYPITLAENPKWLGVNASGTTGYFYISSRGGIFSIQAGRGALVEQYDLLMAAHLNNVLVYVPKPGSWDSLFTMWTQLIPGGDSSMPRPPEQGKDDKFPGYHYAIVVGWYDSIDYSYWVEVAQNRETKDTRALLASITESHFIMVDISTGRSLKILPDSSSAALSKSTGNTVKFSNIKLNFSPSVVAVGNGLDLEKNLKKK